MHSRLYVGQVRHRRFKPTDHSFHYGIFMAYLDLDELPGLFTRHWYTSLNRLNIVSFWRKHHLGASNTDLASAVRDFVYQQTTQRPQGPIRLLTHLSYFGYRFNPVSFYYCFDESGAQLEYIVSEINNTPWGEQYSYVHTVTDHKQASARFQFKKAFHVSPFMPMEIDYDWRFRCPGDHLNVHMINKQEGQKIFDATLQLRQQPFTGTRLVLNLLRFPLVTLKVITAIYYQALRLWLKRVPFHSHPAHKEAPVAVKDS